MHQTIQYVIFVFTFSTSVFRASRLKKYKQETIDEMAELNLKRCDSSPSETCVAALTLIGFWHSAADSVLTTEVIGYCLMGLLLVLSVIRTRSFFCLMDARDIIWHFIPNLKEYRESKGLKQADLCRPCPCAAGNNRQS